MKNKLWAKALVLLPVIALYCSACKKETSKDNGPGKVPATAQLQVFLTDHQSLVFDKILVDIRKVALKLEDDGVDSLGGWFELNIRAGIYDILTLRNGVDTLLANGSIPANRKLQKLRITLGNNNAVEKDGKLFPLSLKDKKGELIIPLNEIRADEIAPGQFRFWIDFDGGQSVREHHGEFELEARLKPFCKSSSGRIEGRVLPAEAKAVVLAINGSDTSSARPEREGEFKIVGLKAGTYQLYIDATANNHKDTLITNVVVRTNEDTKAGSIVLHK